MYYNPYLSESELKISMCYNCYFYLKQTQLKQIVNKTLNSRYNIHTVNFSSIVPVVKLLLFQVHSV